MEIAELINSFSATKCLTYWFGQTCLSNTLRQYFMIVHTTAFSFTLHLFKLHLVCSVHKENINAKLPIIYEQLHSLLVSSSGCIHVLGTKYGTRLLTNPSTCDFDAYKTRFLIQ